MQTPRLVGATGCPGDKDTGTATEPRLANPTKRRCVRLAAWTFPGRGAQGQLLGLVRHETSMAA